MVLVLGMREMPGFLEQWQLDAGDLRRRMYWAPTPRERERWHALWLLVQGWTAVAVAGRWDGMPIPLAGGLPSSARAVRGRWPSSSRVVPPRDRRSAADRTEGSGAGGSSKGWPRLGQLDPSAGSGGRWCADLCRNVSRSP